MPQLTSIIHKCHITKERAVKITYSSGRVRLRWMPSKEQSEGRMSDSWLQSEHRCGHRGRNTKGKILQFLFLLSRKKVFVLLSYGVTDRTF